MLSRQSHFFACMLNLALAHWQGSLKGDCEKVKDERGPGLDIYVILLG